MKNEIVIYQSQELARHIEVRIEDETVWLSQAQMTELFQTTKQNISLHINNIYKEGELQKESTVKDCLTVRNEGNRQVKRKITLYNLDVIISVGYRVKSKQGTQFRIWATGVLKEYLLKGYAINNRMNRIEDNMEQLTKKVNEIDLQLKTNLPPNQGIFFDESKLTEDDFKALLTTWKTYDGIPLTQSLQEIDLGGYKAYYSNNKLYLMNKGFKTENLKAMLENIDSDKKFNPTSIIAFGYYFESKSLREIAENTSTYNNKKYIDIDFITRY